MSELSSQRGKLRPKLRNASTVAKQNNAVSSIAETNKNYCLELKCIFFKNWHYTVLFLRQFWVYVKVWRLFYLPSKKISFFQTFAWIQTHLYSFVDSCWTWAICREEKLTLLLFLFKGTHIIFVMSVKNVSPKPFVSQKQYYLQCLTQGEIYPKAPSLPADLLTCL